MADAARPDDVADPAAAPAEPAAQPAADDFEKSLQEYQASISRPATDQASTPATGDAPHKNGAPLQATGDEIDQLLGELSQSASSSPQSVDPQQQQAVQQAAQERLASLQSENAQLRAHMQRAADQRDLDQLSGLLQARLPSHLPPDYAAAALKSMALDRPELVLAFDYRGADPRAVAQELRQIQMQLSHTSLPAARSQLEQYAQHLNIAINSKSILRRAMIEIREHAESYRPIDSDASADHDAVAAAVRGASGKASPDPPPNFGNMTDAQLRKYTKENFGF
jgi:DNA repair exonuclease SbcCD ATPase subunit